MYDTNGTNISLAPVPPPDIAAQGPKPLIMEKTKKRIVKSVVVIHIAVVLLPLVVLFTADLFKSKDVVVSKVVLVDSAPNDNMTPSMNPGESPVPPPPDVKPLPPEPVPLPPAPVPDAPVPESRPKPEKTVKTPKPEKPVKTVVPKKPQHLTKDDILKNIRRGTSTTKTVSNTKNTSRNTNSSRRPDFAQMIRDSVKAGGAGGPKGTKVDPNVDDYYARVEAYIRSRWIDQPGISELDGKQPVVKVYFTVDGRGNILSTDIDKCGIRAMDVSVERLVSALRQLPAPTGGEKMTFYVNMRVSAL